MEFLWGWDEAQGIKHGEVEFRLGYMYTVELNPLASKTRLNK